jgi:ribokinase
MNSAHILVAGSANLDFVVRAARIPGPGETMLGHGLMTFAGGKGANQAVACARAGGAATHLLLALGDDSSAAVIEASLRSAGVWPHIVRVADAPTGSAFICVSGEGENAITVAAGANEWLLPEHLPPLAAVSHLLLQLETPLPTVLAYAQAAHDAGVVVVLNAAPAQSLAPELLNVVDVLVLNEGELGAIAGRAGGIAEQVARLSPPHVVVTLGARGCIARTPQGWRLQGAYAVRVVDTTAAGDTFCGALAAALGEGRPWPDALCFASAAAALACTRPGAQASMPDRAEVDHFVHAQTPASQADLAALAAYCGLPA